jgi:hypothetical protein
MSAIRWAIWPALARKLGLRRRADECRAKPSREI